MDFGLSETQELLRRTLREFLQREYPTRAVREAETSERGYDPGVYRRLAELGVLGLSLPEDEGGAGGGWADLAVLYEESGRALLASPHLSSVVLGGGLLARAGSAAQRRTWLPELASGARILAVGWPLESGEPGPSGLTARAADGGYVVSGEVAHVADYVGSDALLLVAQMADGDDRLGLFLVEPAVPGLVATLEPLQSSRPLARLRLDGVRLGPDAAVGERQPAAALFGPTLDGAKMAVAAQALGGAAAAVDLAVAYAKERHQFGRPVGTFQAIQHRLANLAMLVEEVRLLVYAAAWQLDRGEDARRAAAMAKLRAGTAFREAATGCILVHGGYGFMLEADPQLYYRRAKALEFALGAPDAQRALIAAEHRPFVAV